MVNCRERNMDVEYAVGTTFAAALGIAEPWKILAVEFHSEPKRLDIKVGFERGARFEYENDAGEKTFYTAYDKIEKQWRHLNFFEHEC